MKRKEEDEKKKEKRRRRREEKKKKRRMNEFGIENTVLGVIFDVTVLTKMFIVGVHCLFIVRCLFQDTPPCLLVNMFFFFWRDSHSPQWAMASSFTRFLDHTQRRITVGGTPLDE